MTVTWRWGHYGQNEPDNLTKLKVDVALNKVAEVLDKYGITLHSCSCCEGIQVMPVEQDDYADSVYWADCVRFDGET